MDVGKYVLKFLIIIYVVGHMENQFYCDMTRLFAIG